MSDLSRRNFCKKSLTILAAAPAIVALSNNASAQAAAPTKALDPANPTAVALGYHEDTSKVDAAKWPKKGQADGANQKCSNCMLYTKGGLKADGKAGDWGVCGIFPQGLVSANGWCNSWAAKPA